jgi:hypothetical protein
MGKKAREIAMERFSLEHVVKLTEEIILDAVRGKA